MSVTLDEVRQVMNEADCLFTGDEVEVALDRLAGEISARLADRNPLVLCVMYGGLVVTGKLLPKLPFPLEVEYLHATRYGHHFFGTELDWRVRPSADLRGRTVLIVDDILDEGATLDAIAEWCREEGAAEVLTAVLVDKEHDRKTRPGLKADFTGVVSPDRFLFGCGMDYKGYWRNAPGIYAVKGY
ncbi:hypoxanthine-guanine phosphoribosyltransferase [Geobacter sp.]|uniref:hypoxanthine-guanine phosphoribosyltransferase n=1 Tax=Geobacter sp. TaxID=46610 RepID=UPI00260478C0|nr:hypoxanthine-guanine phosphoribosyltransferase [Geobacter sp.]